MQDLLLEATEPWGVTVERVEVRFMHISSLDGDIIIMVLVLM